MKKVQGFTLIELLVVIAIIGILASIVITSVNTARVKAADSKIEAELVNLRSAAELYYSTHANYGTSSTATCNPQTGNFFLQTEQGIAQFVTSPTIVCNSNGMSWAAQDNLTASSTYWCVDSRGSSKETTTPLAGAVVCP